MVDDPRAVTQATFCATLVDEWVRGGVSHAVVSPGSRSTPLALALAADDRIAVEVHHDERCAGFMALGHGLATGRPAVALCTSGTAATHFHAAVVEAHHARVPLLVCTADRPPELRDVGAPQTIDQSHLYGRAVRWFFDPGPPDEAMRASWRSIAARAVLEAADGPVHLNLPFREPLVADAGALPDGRADGEPWTTGGGGDGDGPVVGLEARRGLVVAGRGGDLPLGRGWPVLADAMFGGETSTPISHADALLRIPAVAAELQPDAIVRVGGPPASRVVNEWLAATTAPTHVVGAAFHDPAHAAATVGHRIVRLLTDPDPAWTARWLELDALAEAAIAGVLADHAEATEPGTARDLLAALPTGAHLVVASSMPVRDLEWYAVPRADVAVHANRGANGIDGVLSTAVGVALATGAPTACLLGDVAFLHDSNALLGAPRRGLDLTVVVVDNDGGGIFSFLPQRTMLPPDRFEQLFGTPHGVRPEAIAAAHGVDATVVERAAELTDAVRQGSGTRLVVVRTDRSANVALHDELHAAVAAAVAAR